MTTPEPSAVTTSATTAVDHQARETALASYTPPEPTPHWVEYRSHGRLLIIGPADAAWSAAKGLSDQLDSTVLATRAPAEPPEAPPPAPTAYGHVSQLTGYLGNFELEIKTETGPTATSTQAFGARHATHDLVLDLDTAPTLHSEVTPPGYFHAPDPTARQQALQDLPDMVGEFEKPRYIDYDPNICAHGERGLAGCRACIDVCAADAPFSVGERIEVNFNLCQGCGSCTAACPTGAITYALPPASDLLGALRQLLAQYRGAGGTAPVLVMYNDTLQKPDISQLPESILPVAVEDIGAVGLESWLTLLAYGAHQIRLFTPPDTAPSLLETTRGQIELARTILATLDGATTDPRVVLTTTPEEAFARATMPALLDQAATFAAIGSKREIFRMALDHLYQHCEHIAHQTALPEHAPFGTITVNGDACTLCMACVSVCPSSAVQGGGDKPELWFREDHCVQCGLCEKACPEDAITLEPRLDLTAHLQPEKRLLHEERMQLCLGCGRPFATHKVISRMQEKLKDHWMFQTAEARQLLLLCEDCRIQRAFDSDHGINPHKQ